MSTANRAFCGLGDEAGVTTSKRPRKKKSRRIKASSSCNNQPDALPIAGLLDGKERAEYPLLSAGGGIMLFKKAKAEDTIGANETFLILATEPKSFSVRDSAAAITR